MSFSNEKSLHGIRWALLQVVEGVANIKETFSVRQNLAAENERLKKDHFELSTENQQLREMLVSENKRLKKLLALKKESEYEYVTARVIGTSAAKGFRSIILNIGTNDSIAAQMPVVNADGLIGKIVIAEKSQSIVQLLTDYNANISARLQDSREAGMITWPGSSWLELDLIPRNVRVEKGEAVVTSGLSEIYPAGIKIGFVTSTSEVAHDLFKKIRVKPSVNFNAIEEVFVIVKKKPGEVTSESN